MTRSLRSPSAATAHLGFTSRAYLGCVLMSLWSLGLGCASGKHWVKQPFNRHHADKGVQLFDGRDAGEPQRGSGVRATARIGAPPDKPAIDAAPIEDETGPRPQVQLTGAKKLRFVPPPDGRLLGEFRNTYYDFPAEATFPSQASDASSAGSGASKVTLMNRSCQPIKEVERSFFESLCVQGSGSLLSGTTVSFAKRDCSCAEVCPRTGQKICFDALDPALFPWGRGALGKAITPLTSVAVDSDVIPLGTPLYIAEYDGVERHRGGGRHNGCFVAEDRGMKVQGKHVDIFTGNPTVTMHLNALVPSNAGVHVYVDTAQCR